jgi:hypothetical protein
VAGSTVVFALLGFLVLPLMAEGPGFEVVAEGMRRAHGRVGEEYERLL